jgi:hypothetical protein
VGHLSCASPIREGWFETEADGTLGHGRGTTDGMTTGISALAAELALTCPDKGGGVGIPAAGGGFEPSDNVLWGSGIVSLERTALENTLTSTSN